MEPIFHEYEDTAALLKSIAHPVRICIIMGLERKGYCNVTDMKCGLDLPQSTVSTHLGILRDAGVVETLRKGTEIYYQLKDQRIIEILHTLGVKNHE
ncbi:Biofilm growth-associated repressor [bioreactor metagenome]|uniref:Biofilm growth-associated repressor n=1 Tax=bioreactor metagenome TaxID=1076179 RepID=A0A645IE07_9ZZZZ|nr:metalloregulator ArsR/SmtB family transcription factor [Proteiniclasticum sp. QWL-01]UUM12361.1 metalloregulator ArsR/SmtB family transcription factor [Clostridiaceae bacterium HFYG-1003]WFF73891.1 metalloregulator ArsR/SmtB family transcription factor [Proteiniclasticum sp. QWL-01]